MLPSVSGSGSLRKEKAACIACGAYETSADLPRRLLDHATRGRTQGRASDLVASRISGRTQRGMSGSRAPRVRGLAFRWGSHLHASGVQMKKWHSREVPTNVHLRWQRQKLHQYDPRCYYCGRVTRLLETNGGHIPDDAATIEHLDSRYSDERGKHSGEYRRVLACRKCNNERSSPKAHGMAIQEIWERDGHLFKIAKMLGALNEIEAR